MDTPNNRPRRTMVLRPAKLQPAVKAALRQIRRQDNKETILVSGTNDPKNIRRDILVTKTVEATITATTGFTNAAIYKLLDVGTTPFFTQMRIISCSAYGGTEGLVRADVVADGASFSDYGVMGSKRAALHLRFPEITRITWVPTASTSSVITVTGATATVPFVVQFTIEVRGDASGDA